MLAGEISRYNLQTSNPLKFSNKVKKTLRSNLAFYRAETLHCIPYEWAGGGGGGGGWVK